MLSECALSIRLRSIVIGVLFASLLFAASASAAWPNRLTTPASTSNLLPVEYTSRDVDDQYIYLDRPTSTSANELYRRAPEGGGTPQKYNIPLASKWSVQEWYERPNRNEFFVSTGRKGPEKYYWVDRDDPNDVELISPIFPTDSSEIISLNSTSDFGLVTRMYWYGNNEVYGLSSISLTGGQPVNFYVPPDHASGYQSYRLSSDGQRVTYFVSQNTAPFSRLFSSPLDGSTPPVELFNSGSVGTNNYSHTITSDSSRVLYSFSNAVYSVPIAGGASVQLSPSLAPGGTLSGYTIVGNRALFAANFNVAGKTELYSAPLDGSSPAVRLNGDLIDEGDTSNGMGKVIGSVPYALFTADAIVDGQLIAYARKADGTGPLIEFGDSTKHAAFSSFVSTPSERIGFLADTLNPNDDVFELFTTTLSDPHSVVATGALFQRSQQPFFQYEFSPDGNWLFYADNYTATNVYSTIKAVATDGSVAPFEVASAPFLTNDPAGLSVPRLRMGELSNDGQSYLFVGYSTSPSAEAMYSVAFQPPTLPGDFNDDGIVDSADYVVWRKNIGNAPRSLPNDPYFRVIGAEQYETWRTNFGRTSAAEPSTASSVPEPASILLAALAAAACSGRLVPRRRTS